MTLEPAKCPSGGANIEVNKNLEKTIFYSKTNHVI